MQNLMQTKVKLQPNEMTGVPAMPPTEVAGEEGQEPTEQPATDAIPPYEDPLAVVRIRIAKKIPEPEEDEEGNMITPEYKEEDLEEMPIDDKALAVCTNDGEGKSIMVINQAAQRVFRKELFTEFSAACEALKGVDLAEFGEFCEKDAEEFETAFVALFENEQSKAPFHIPVFDFAPTV